MCGFQAVSYTITLMLTAGANELVASLKRSPSAHDHDSRGSSQLDAELCGSWFVSPSDGGVEAGMPHTPMSFEVIRDSRGGRTDNRALCWQPSLRFFFSSARASLIRLKTAPTLARSKRVSRHPARQRRHNRACRGLCSRTLHH